MRMRLRTVLIAAAIAFMVACTPQGMLAPPAHDDVK